MRISAKGRYALASIIEIARQTQEGEIISVINIADILGISKIYLEQVFSQLKNSGIIFAIKGPKGGYQLKRKPESITVLDVLIVTETTLIEQTDINLSGQASVIETVLQEKVFIVLDKVIKDCLESFTIQDLLESSELLQTEQAFMLNM